MQLRTTLIALSFCLSTLTGCTVKEAIAPLEPTAFVLHPERLTKPEYTPFDLAWRSPYVAKFLYSTVHVEAVRFDFVDYTDWVFSTSSLLPTEESYREEVQQLADYIQQSLIEAFKSHSDERHSVTVLSSPPVEELPESVPRELRAPTEAARVRPRVESLDAGGRTLVVQLSLSEANFGDPVVYGGLLAVPFPAIANLSTAVKSPLLTIEGRFIDQTTGEVVAELVDRRFPQVKPIDLNRLTVSSALRELADSFAHDIVRSFYRDPDEKVERRWRFSLLPW